MAGTTVFAQTNFVLEPEGNTYLLKVTLNDSSLLDSIATNDIELKELLNVYVGKNADSESPSIYGEYQLNEYQITFKPKFGFQQGVQYSANVGDDYFEFKLPSTQKEEVKIAAIYPSADSLPANVLKFYIYFNEPMGEANFYPYVQILDENQDTVQQAIVELMPALWSDDQKRLTLWMNPGRIKRELGPNEALGAPLEAGKKYTLQISDRFRSKKGAQLDKTYSKSFYVVPADRTQPLLSKWNIEKPEAGTTEPLKIDFKESVDYALLQKSISILNTGLEEMEGEFTIGKNEQSWIFTPVMPWKMGKVIIRVSGKLEDLSGNNLNRLFDTDLKKEGRRKPEKEFFELEIKL